MAILHDGAFLQAILRIQFNTNRRFYWAFHFGPIFAVAGNQEGEKMNDDIRIGDWVKVRTSVGLTAIYEVGEFYLGFAHGVMGFRKYVLEVRKAKK